MDPNNGLLELTSYDLLIEMLRKASNESKSNNNSSRKSFSIWELRNYRKLVSFIFDLISFLKIEDPFVRYNTCDLYEEFLEHHIDNLKCDLSRDEMTNELSLWFHIKDQSLLRLLTCIMLSCKVSSSLSIRSLEEYCSLIRKFGQDYSKATIVKSELRVMKTVNYKIDQCPLNSICPLLILTLVHNEPSIDGQLLYSFLHKTMDFYYLTKADILSKLYDHLKESRKFDYE